MKKCFVLAGLCALVAGTALAQEAKRVLTPEEKAARRARMQQMMLKHTGGFVVRPGSQQGEIVYVNCQKRVPKAWIDDSIAYFAKETRFKIGYKEGTFAFPSPQIEGNATLFIIDEPGLPALLVAPESRWAFVNVAVVAQEKRPAFFEARMRKQLSRGFAYLCGAANSQFPMCLTRGIVDEADLDKNADARLPMDLFQRFQTYMAPLGVKPAQRATYRNALLAGWAPAPTNAVQQAIWDKMQAEKERGPTNGLQIPPPKK